MKYLIVLFPLLWAFGVSFAQDQVDVEHVAWSIIELPSGVTLRLPPAQTEMPATGQDSITIQVRHKPNFFVGYTYMQEITSLEAIQQEIEAQVQALGERARFTLVVPMTLPVGEAILTEIATYPTDSTESIHRIAYTVALGSGRIEVFGILSGGVGDEEIEDARAIVERIANTLYIETAQSWQLHADESASVFVRTPRNWVQALNPTMSITVRRTFSDVLLSIQAQELRGDLTLGILQDDLTAIYRQQGYTIESVTVQSLPVGEALTFYLSGISVSRRNHTQIQYAILRTPYVILITAGADERYFEGVERVLKQIVDTVQFRPDETTR